MSTKNLMLTCNACVNLFNNYSRYDVIQLFQMDNISNLNYFSQQYDII